ncbi:MAG TPA: hypothetical protein VF623_10135, partial [Segetibacter sp.]
MNSPKILNHVFLIILLLLSDVLLAQNIEIDTTTPPRIETNPYALVIEEAGIYLSKFEYDNARFYYQKALAIKPADNYATKMLRYIETAIWGDNQKKIRDQELKDKAEINALMSNAMTAILQKKYDTARSLYTRVLSLNPVKSQEEFARQKIATLDLTLGGPRTNVEEIIRLAKAERAKSFPQNKEAAIANSSTADASATQIPVEKTAADLLMDSAITALTNNDFASARIFYTRLLKLNSSRAQQQIAKQKINAIDINLAEAPHKVEVKTPPVELMKTADLLVKNEMTATKIPAQKDLPAIKIPEQKVQPATVIAAEQGGVKVKTHNDSIMDNAQQLLAAKDYENARILYSMVLSSNATKAQQQ